jgi:hypothetical protein
MTEQYEAYVSPAGKDWMQRCHPQPDVLVAVASGLIFRIQMIRTLGPRYGQNPGRPIRKLHGVDDLWESRVRHQAGEFRQFFRFGRVAGRSAAVFIDGAHKKAPSLPQQVYDGANARLDRFVADLVDDPLFQDRCRIR